MEQAHALGRPAAAHATEREIARRMVDAGVDILVHSISNEPIDPELLRLIQEKDILYINRYTGGQ